MKKDHLSSTRSSVAGNSGNKGTNTRSKGEVVLGSLVWVRLDGDSWWPAQVVDGDNVSESNKPSNSFAGEVLVRLYGSYKYLYVDPLKCQYEFESVLKQNNGTYHHVFVKALERELPSSISSQLKEPGCQHTERSNGASKDNRSNEDTEERTQNLEDRTSEDADAEGYADLSAKRTAGHGADPMAERTKLELGSKRADGATLKTFHRGKTRRKERPNDNKDPSNSKDSLPKTPRTVEAGEAGISGGESIDKCLEQKNASTKNLNMRTPNQDRVKKNYEFSTDNASVSAERKKSNSKHDSVSSRIKLYGRSAAEKAKLRLSGQLGPKVKPKALGTSIQSKVESRSLKHHEGKSEQKQKSLCQHEQQSHGEADRHDSMPRGLKRKGQIIDHDKECKILKQEENQKNCKSNSSRVDENLITELPLLDRPVKKLNANKRKTEQDTMQKEHKPDMKYAKQETEMQAAKEVEFVKKKKPLNTIAISPSSSGRAQEVCTRRLRVMRSLGLVSPAGSPFQKGEQHCLSF